MFDFISKLFTKPRITSVFDEDTDHVRAPILDVIQAYYGSPSTTHFTAAELQQLKVFISEMINYEEDLIRCNVEYLVDHKRVKPEAKEQRVVIRKDVQKRKKRIASLVALQKKIKYSIVTRG